MGLTTLRGCQNWYAKIFRQHYEIFVLIFVTSEFSPRRNCLAELNWVNFVNWDELLQSCFQTQFLYYDIRKNSWKCMRANSVQTRASAKCNWINWIIDHGQIWCSNICIQMYVQHTLLNSNQDVTSFFLFWIDYARRLN